MKYYAILGLAVLLLAVNFVFTKLYQKQRGDSLTEALLFNMYCGAFTAVAFFFINGCKIEINLFAAAMAFLVVLFGVVYTLIGFKIMASGKMAYYTFFLMLGGMVVPYIWGVINLGEQVSVLRIIGLCVIAGSAFILYADKNGITKKVLFLCLAVFLLNGLISVASKEHQISPLSVSANGFVLLTGAFKALGCFVALPFVKSNDRSKEKRSRKMPWLLLLGATLSSGLSYMLQLLSASELPATVLYPALTGGTILISAIAGWLCFKEKITGKMLIGLLICFAGTCMFL